MSHYVTNLSSLFKYLPVVVDSFHEKIDNQDGNAVKNVIRLMVLLPVMTVGAGCSKNEPVDTTNTDQVAAPGSTGQEEAPESTDRELTPEPVAPSLSLTVVGGNGSGVIALTGQQTTYPITADVQDGQTFLRWSGDVEFLENPNSASTNVILPTVAESYYLEAIFELDPNLNLLTDDNATSRFLTFASFGATTDDIDQWQGKDAALWLRSEFGSAPNLMTKEAIARRNPVNSRMAFSGYTRYQLDRSLYDGPSQLRTRMAFALSQILVVGSPVGTGDTGGSGVAYNDVLQTHAFGNFRDLLEAVTYSTAMGKWLTYLGNAAGDPATGREPDENYARELLQLFTIGLYELNMDGSQKLDETGSPIETYVIEDIANLARVFTGLTFDGSDELEETIAANRASGYLPMVFFKGAHSTREKAFLGTVIPENTPGEESIDLALDTIFAHPNIAPFLARQLIQRFSASNPSASYIARVAGAFEAGRFISASGEQFGDGQRGNLEATLAAVLLERTLFVDPGFTDHSEGKVREDILRLAHWMRAFKVQNLEWLLNQSFIKDTSHARSLRIGYMQSQSVFNFYRPGFVPGQTESGDRGMTVPEFQISDTGSTARYMNVMAGLVLRRKGSDFFQPCKDSIPALLVERNPCSEVEDEERIDPDYSREIALADNPEALVDHLDTLLVGGRLEADEREEIIAAVNLVELSGDDEALEDRAELAILMVVLSPAYAVVY